MRNRWLGKLFLVLALGAVLVLVPQIIPLPALAQSSQPLAPGLYVTGLRIEPPQPTLNNPISFFATILNNSGPYSNVKWLVQIYPAADDRRAIGQTSADGVFDIPVGTTEFKSNGFWKTGPGDACQYYTARVVLLDNDKKAITFKMPDGSIADFPLAVCASWPSAPPPQAAVAPTAAPPIPAPTVIPTMARAVPTTISIAPRATGTPDLSEIARAMMETIRSVGADIKGAPLGLYVTGLRLDPAKPAHAQFISFYVSFLNTASSPRTVRWKISVYGTDNQQRANAESAVVQATLPSGQTLEQKVPATFRLQFTGNNCDYFFVRVGILDKDNDSFDLNTPEGEVFEQGFSVCQ